MKPGEDLIERLTKKQIERRYLESFRGAFKAFPAGEIDDDRESPDFVIRGARCIGVELMRLFRPDDAEYGGSLRAQESLQFMIASRALALYGARGLPMVDVHILFHRSQLRKADVSTYAQAIAEVVAQRVPSEGASSEWTAEHEPTLLALPGVARIHVLRWPNIKESFFAPSMATWRSHVGARFVQASIDGKNPLRATYDSECDEMWLLLAYGREGLPSMMTFDEGTFTHQYSTAFDRVFLFGWNEELRELTLI